MSRPDGHDLLCPWEQKRIGYCPPPPESCPACETIRDARADLIAKVDALPVYSTAMHREWVDGAGWLPTNKVIDTVLLGDVLAILRGDA